MEKQRKRGKSKDTKINVLAYRCAQCNALLDITHQGNEKAPKDEIGFSNVITEGLNGENVEKFIGQEIFIFPCEKCYGEAREITDKFLALVQATKITDRG